MPELEHYNALIFNTLVSYQKVTICKTLTRHNGFLLHSGLLSENDVLWWKSVMTQQDIVLLSAHSLIILHSSLN